MDPHRAHLALVAGRGNVETQAFELNYGLFHGTAFCFAPNLVLTAAHVVHAAQGDGEVAVALLAHGTVEVRAVQNAEIFDEIDLAILVCPGLRAEILPFTFRRRSASWRILFVLASRSVLSR